LQSIVLLLRGKATMKAFPDHLKC